MLTRAPVFQVEVARQLPNATLEMVDAAHMIFAEASGTVATGGSGGSTSNFPSAADD
ncbi:hypothetical protein [Rhodococcus sp. ACS1]|uniref:hypothetical protein n=1 Tax=Rhodococcus sp. ACS1 TaxID=2028570 RepID=UPI001C52B43C|nr:hypothetical protein [Rhodococcus sp. ACS1]